MMHADGSISQAVGEASQALVDEGMLDGSRLRVLFRRKGGFSLSHAWFKSGFPLPLHSHSTPCLYYIVAGTLRIGTQELGPGDGFYLDANMPYIYTPGPQGVEVLEFRDSDHFDIKIRSRNVKWWHKALEKLRLSRQRWPDEGPPSGRLVG
ncbi:MAG: cupin domain-containing protein [Novosphingobium sp.]